MSHPYFHHDFVIWELNKLAIDKSRNTAIDLGMGRGVWGYLMRVNNRFSDTYLVGIDLHLPDLKFCKKYRIYDDLIQADVNALPFRDKVCDVTLALELIEHLKKEEGKSLLIDLERITRKKIIITTPNGFYAQDALAGKESERHLSRWTVADFKILSYSVRGFSFKYYYKIPSIALRGLLRYTFTPISYLLPWFGEFLIATKEL